MMRLFYLTIILLLCFRLETQAQIAIAGTTPVTENFDGMGATTSLPANWKFHQNAAPAYASGTGTLTAQASAGSPTAGGTYNWGSSATERAAGVMTSGSYASPNSLMAFYTNTNTSAITQLTVSYDLERYRRNTAAASVQFYYSTNGSTWTAVTAGDIAAATIGTGTSVYAYSPPNLTINVATFNITGLNIINGGSIYLRWNLNTTGSNSQGIAIDNVSVTATFGGCILPSEPSAHASSLVFSNIACGQMDVSWTNGNGSSRIVVARAGAAVSGTPVDESVYAASAAFGSGNTIAVGEYVVYSGTGSSVTVTGLAASATYYFTVFEFEPGSTCPNYYTAGTPLSGSQATIACPAGSCPQINSILVNSCGGSTNEGLDEYLMFTTGSNPVDVNNITVNFPAITPYCNSGCGTQTLLNNATYINNLNTQAGCPGLFSYAAIIPANSYVVVFTGYTPSYVYDFSTGCPGPFYAVFCNNSSTVGRFANNSGSNRTLSVSFGGSCNDTVTYFSSAATNSDGDFINFDAAGTPSYMNNGVCAIGPLPIELLSFTAVEDENTVNLLWSTASETNNDHFIVERTADGDHYKEIAAVNGAGTSSEIHHYDAVDRSPLQGLSYYRLKQIDHDGAFTYSPLVPVNMNAGEELGTIIQDNASNTVIIDPLSESLLTIDVLDARGITVYRNTVTGKVLTISTGSWSAGIYVIRLGDGKQLLTRKILVN